MAERVRAGLTAREGRRFAFPVGTAFLLFAAVFWWRDRELAAQVLVGLGGLLLVAGIVVPSRLGPVFRAWMGLAHAISKVTTPVFMGVVYYLVMAPIGFVRRTLGSNPVRHRPVQGSYWRDRDPEKRRGNLQRQF